MLDKITRGEGTLEDLDKMEELLTEGISDQELEQFMATVEKLKKNLS